MTCRTWPNRGW